MTDTPCDTTMLEALRRQALVQAAKARDLLLRQHYMELADSYAETAIELRDHGAAILPPIMLPGTRPRAKMPSASNDP